MNGRISHRGESLHSFCFTIHQVGSQNLQDHLDSV